MYLYELLKDWPCIFKGEELAISIQGVTEHSNRVQPGYLFIARKGNKQDGFNYIQEAVRLGAAAVVVDRELSIDIEIPIVTVPNCSGFMSYASAKLAGNPSERLTVIAITGTNGKTTVAHFMGQLLMDLDVEVAVLGTLGVSINGKQQPYQGPSMTTLPAEYLHPLLAKCEKQGVTHVVMEASSLGLSTERLAHCEIDIGILLNIGEDHYEEHGSKKAYIRAKKRLIEMAETVIINYDDQICRKMAATREHDVIYFGMEHDVHFQMNQKENTFTLKTDEATKIMVIKHREKFNQMNLLAAISGLRTLSYDLNDILLSIENLKLPAGRMEMIDRHGITVIIDYAHTPDALEAVLSSFADNKKIITVFGCGGNRDHKKRKKMGKIASRKSSMVIVTSDNPRDENPLEIISEIIDGMEKGSSYLIEVNRESAIRQAILKANDGDIVLIAGKGHEEIQIIQGKVYPFSDKQIALEQLEQKFKAV